LQEAQVEQAKLEIRSLSMSVEMYRLQKRTCPASMKDMVAAGILTKASKDPWDNDYSFTCPGEHGDVDISSSGKDGERGTDDDINSWEAEAESPHDGDIKRTVILPGEP
jgi:general secretion pathway protein G